MKSHSEAPRANTLMGQHFLHSTRVIESMVRAADITKKDVVLEVGPGRGILTALLAQNAKRVVAIEKDARLVEFLKEKFAAIKNSEIIYGDILKIDLSGMLPTKYKIVANLPYYITSQFLRKFLGGDTKHPARRPTSSGCPVSITVMVQKEVAMRIVATPPHMNLLALSTQAYGSPKIVMRVSRKFFRPKPAVDSAVIHIANVNNSFFTKNKIPEKVFFDTARRAFQQKRKILKNSIGVNSQRRPQELSLEDWVNTVLRQKYL